MKDNRFHNIILMQLNKMSHDEFMEVFYNLVISSPQELLDYDEDPQHKIIKINNLLKHFEEKEQYERCIKIKELKKLINDKSK
jgi:hypothetical protein